MHISREDKEGLEIELDAIRADSERHETRCNALQNEATRMELELEGIRADSEGHVLTKAEMTSDNDSLRRELAVLKGETEQLVSLLGNIL